MSTTVRADAARAKTVKVIELRTAGLTFARIAQIVGFSNASAARKAWLRGIAAEEEAQKGTREEQRLLMNVRLERLIQSAWSDAAGGNMKAVETIRRLMAQQAQLNGLNAPVRVEVSDSMQQEIEALLADLAAQTAGPTPAS